MPSSQQERSSSSNFHWVSQSVGLQEVVYLHKHHMCFFMAPHIVRAIFPRFLFLNCTPKFSLGFPPFPRSEASTVAQRWIDLRSGFGAPSHCATGTEHLAPLGPGDFFYRRRRWPGKVVMERMKQKKSGAWIFWGIFFVVFRVVFMLEGFFVGGFLLG